MLVTSDAGSGHGPQQPPRNIFTTQSVKPLVKTKTKSKKITVGQTVIVAYVKCGKPGHTTKQKKKRIKGLKSLLITLLLSINGAPNSLPLSTIIFNFRSHLKNCL